MTQHQWPFDSALEKALSFVRQPKISEREARLHHRRRHRKSYVYFIAAGRGAVKIGFAHDVESRLQALQTSSAEELVLLHYMEGTTADERRLHEKFAELRIRGEWFRHEGFLAEFIVTLRAGR
jgi:hypothetical protein